MLAHIRGLQGTNPLSGFSCAVDVPHTKPRQVAGFLYQIDTGDKIIWQTHNREEFGHMTTAARYLVDEYRSLRSHPHAQPISIMKINWFYTKFHRGDCDVNQLPEAELKLATLILDQRKYLVQPDVRHKYWQPYNSQFWHFRFWDLANPWLRPKYAKFLAPDQVTAHHKEAVIAANLIKIHSLAVDYLAHL